MAAQRWAEQLLKRASQRGIDANVVNRINGWLETAAIAGGRCFTKSVSYQPARHEYFVGVDPRKLLDDGDFVVICGGRAGQLQDVFVVPWTIFFRELELGSPVNTYKAPREYYQYKLHLYGTADGWRMAVQGADHELPVDQWRHSPDGALTFLTTRAEAG